MQTRTLKCERLYSLAEAQAEIFTSRSMRWIRDTARKGLFGDVIRDSKGWLIPASGIQRYLEANRVLAERDLSAVPQTANLPQR